MLRHGFKICRNNLVDNSQKEMKREAGLVGTCDENELGQDRLVLGLVSPYKIAGRAGHMGGASLNIA